MSTTSSISLAINLAMLPWCGNNFSGLPVFANTRLDMTVEHSASTLVDECCYPFGHFAYGVKHRKALPFEPFLFELQVLKHLANRQQIPADHTLPNRGRGPWGPLLCEGANMSWRVSSGIWGKSELWEIFFSGRLCCFPFGLGTFTLINHIVDMSSV